MSHDATVPESLARDSVGVDDLEACGIQPTPLGYRIKVVDGYAIEAWRMLFNWRLVVFEDGQTSTVEHGYCYFGLGTLPLERAIAAGLAWADPLNTDPVGFDKKAF